MIQLSYQEQQVRLGSPSRVVSFGAGEAPWVMGAVEVVPRWVSSATEGCSSGYIGRRWYVWNRLGSGLPWRSSASVVSRRWLQTGAGLLREAGAGVVVFSLRRGCIRVVCAGTGLFTGGFDLGGRPVQGLWVPAVAEVLKGLCVLAMGLYVLVMEARILLR